MLWVMTDALAALPDWIAANRVDGAELSARPAAFQWLRTMALIDRRPGDDEIRLLRELPGQPPAQVAADALLQAAIDRPRPGTPQPDRGIAAWGLDITSFLGFYALDLWIRQRALCLRAGQLVDGATPRLGTLRLSSVAAETLAPAVTASFEIQQGRHPCPVLTALRSSRRPPRSLRPRSLLTRPPHGPSWFTLRSPHRCHWQTVP